MADRRAVVEVPAEWNAGSCGRELTDERSRPADKPEAPGPGPADQLDGGEEERGKKNEHIGAKNDRLDKEIEDFHQVLSCELSEELSTHG